MKVVGMTGCRSARFSGALSQCNSVFFGMDLLTLLTNPIRPLPSFARFREASPGAPFLDLRTNQTNNDTVGVNAVPHLVAQNLPANSQPNLHEANVSTGSLLQTGWRPLSSTRNPAPNSADPSRRFLKSSVRAAPVHRGRQAFNLAASIRKRFDNANLQRQTDISD
jgi:hypothetical protein